MSSPYAYGYAYEEDSRRRFRGTCVDITVTDTPVGIVAITRGELYGGERKVLAVTINDVELEPLSKNSARWVFRNERYVVKVESYESQSHTEASVWERLEPQDRIYFAPLLAYGPGFTVQRFEQMHKDMNRVVDTREARMVADLAQKYDLKDMHYGLMSQWGIRPDGSLVIHDYGFDSFSMSEEKPSFWPVITRLEQTQYTDVRRLYGDAVIPVSPGFYRLGRTPSPMYPATTVASLTEAEVARA